MKRPLTALLMIVGLGQAGAAAFPLTFGIKGGLTIANFHFSGASAEDWDALHSPRIGVFAGFRFAKNLSVQAEGYYVRKGGRFTAAYGVAEVAIAEHIDYIEVPVLLEWRLPLKNEVSLSVLAGGFYAKRISAKTIVDFGGESYVEDIAADIRSDDYGSVIGAGVSWKRWLLEIRYVKGSADLKKQDWSGYRVTHRTLAVMFGYRF